MLFDLTGIHCLWQYTHFVEQEEGNIHYNIAYCNIINIIDLVYTELSVYLYIDLWLSSLLYSYLLSYNLQILTIAIEKGQLSQPVQTRLSCCKILGKIATRFEPYV